MAKKTTSANQKAKYSVYESTMKWKENRKAKLERHLKANPDDVIAKAALKNLASATKPRRAGYSSHRVVVDGQIIKASDRLYRELKRVVTAFMKADSFQQKNQESQQNAERKKKALKGA